MSLGVRCTRIARRSPKPEVVGSSPTTPAGLDQRGLKVDNSTVDSRSPSVGQHRPVWTSSDQDATGAREMATRLPWEQETPRSTRGPRTCARPVPRKRARGRVPWTVGAAESSPGSHRGAHEFESVRSTPHVAVAQRPVRRRATAKTWVRLPGCPRSTMPQILDVSTPYTGYGVPRSPGFLLSLAQQSVILESCTPYRGSSVPRSACVGSG